EEKAVDDRASAMARLESSRARMRARLNAPREEGGKKNDEEGSGKEEPAPAKGTDARPEGAVPE
ncbi:MAG: hypothetical protein MK133_08180, partial [Planctomycetes bacterium]|nr:hypothetical protein [Planctomycetota bacterium]